MIALLAIGIIATSLWLRGDAEQAAFAIVVDDPPASTWREVTFRKIDPSARAVARKYETMVRREFARHDPALLRRSGMRVIAIVDELAVNGQRRAAVPDYPTGCLYLDPSVGNWSTIYQRHAMHHEFFHLIQGAVHDDQYYKDPSWIALNAPDVRYGSGGATNRDANVYDLTHPADGFINKYAQSSVEEDMAEVFATLFVEEESTKVLAWAKQDQFLRAKVERMRALISEYSANPATTKPSR